MAIEKEDIVQYVQETPGNSNPAVLRSLLNQLEDSGEGATFKVEKEDDEKSYQSAYTGAEIDAAVAKAGTVPDVTSADAGKALVVDEEGKIVTGEAGGGLKEYDYTMPLNYIENFWTELFAFRVSNFTDIDKIYAADVVNFTIPGTEQSPELKIKLYRQIEFFDDADLPMIIFQAFCVPNAATNELDTFNISLAAIKDATPNLRCVITKITTTKGNALSSIL